MRNVPYGESDVVVTLLTEQEGKVAAIVRGARRWSRRTSRRPLEAGGALEPMHTISATYEDKGTDLATLKEARVVRARTGMLARLDAIEAGGTLLRWARHVFPPKTPEPAGFATVLETLDALDAGEVEPNVALAAAGLRLLADVGWGVELSQCVKCGKACPEDAGAQLDPDRGGIVCRSCGGARILLRAPVRRAALAALSRQTFPNEHARALIEVVDAAMAAHAGFKDR